METADTHQDTARAGRSGATSRTSGLRLAYVFGWLALASIEFSNSYEALASGRVFPTLGDGAPGTRLREACHHVVLFTLFVLYTRLLVLWKREPLSLSQVVKLIIPVSLTSALALPAISTDLLYYVALGRIVVLFGGNPYAHPYSHYGDGFSAYLDVWNDMTMPYGPSLLAAFIPAGFLSQYGVFLGVYFLKGVALAAYYGCCAVLLRLLRQTGRDPAFGLFVFALNPLVILEHLITGHNDGPMILFGLLALSALLGGRHVRSVGWALLATITKVPAIVGLGLILAHLFWKRHWSALARGLALSLAVGAVLVVTMLPSLQTGVAKVDTMFSLHSAVFDALFQFCGWTSSDDPAFQRWLVLDRNVSVASFFAFLAFRLWVGRHRQEAGGVIREQLTIYLVLLIFQATWFLPWYVTWLVPLAALVESTTLTWSVVAYSWSVTALYHAGSWQWYVTQILIAHGAPLVVLGRAWLKRPSLEREPSGVPA